jgi:hypothetical protein
VKAVLVVLALLRLTVPCVPFAATYCVVVEESSCCAPGPVCPVEIGCPLDLPAAPAPIPKLPGELELAIEPMTVEVHSRASTPFQILRMCGPAPRTPRYLLFESLLI